MIIEEMSYDELVWFCVDQEITTCAKLKEAIGAKGKGVLNHLAKLNEEQEIPLFAKVKGVLFLDSDFFDNAIYPDDSFVEVEDGLLVNEEGMFLVEKQVIKYGQTFSKWIEKELRYWPATKRPMIMHNKQMYRPSTLMAKAFMKDVDISKIVGAKTKFKNDNHYDVRLSNIRFSA